MHTELKYKYMFEELSDEKVCEFANTVLLGLRVYVIMKNRDEATAFLNGYIAGLGVSEK